VKEVDQDENIARAKFRRFLVPLEYGYHALRIDVRLQP
jgi:hypothetical protein